MARKRQSYPLIEGLEITSLAAEGKSIGRHEGAVVFVPMTVPGDVVDVQIRAKHERTHSFSVGSEVRFRALTDEEIAYYVETYRPLDKAGAYGIQEWIGYVGIEGIHGSFYNVMGLPVQRLYMELGEFCK